MKLGRNMQSRPNIRIRGEFAPVFTPVSMVSLKIVLAEAMREIGLNGDRGKIVLAEAIRKIELAEADRKIELATVRGDRE